MKRQPITIPTLLGILVLLAGLGMGLWFLREPIRNAVFAASETTPDQVRITNVTDSGFTVSWTTVKATSGYVQYGEGQSPNLVVSDDRDQAGGSVQNYFTHFVTVNSLKPATTYTFRLGSGGQLYTATTGLTLGSPPAADVAYGQVLTASGEPADGAIVYLSLAGAVPQAGLVKPGGAWVIPLSTARSADLTSFAAYDRTASQIQLEIIAGPLGSATVTTITSQDNPVPLITLGQQYNLAAVSLPSPLPTESRLSVSPLQPAALTLLSPKPQEAVNSSQPQIIGRGPARAEVTIIIQSPATITETVTTDADGDFSYTVPEDLAPGEHTLTVSTTVDGVLKKIQRKFTVLAAGESVVPAFTASPAAKLKPSPTPTLKPRVALPATESGVPTSGNLTPTLVLLILGAIMVTSGTVLFGKLKIEN